MLVDITVAYGTDIDRATSIVNEVGEAMMHDKDWVGHLLEAPSLLRVDALGELGMTLRVTGKVRVSDRFTAPGGLRKRVLAAFQANVIDIPVRSQVVMAQTPTAPAPETPTGDGSGA